MNASCLHIEILWFPKDTLTISSVHRGGAERNNFKGDYSTMPLKCCQNLPFVLSVGFIYELSSRGLRKNLIYFKTSSQSNDGKITCQYCKMLKTFMSHKQN